jgi:glycosyltransferase involved in cell wall biosynthesis
LFVLPPDFSQRNSPARALTVVIAVYNGEASLPDLRRRIIEVLPSVATSYEIILVNDCGRDCSWEIISQLVVT